MHPFFKPKGRGYASLTLMGSLVNILSHAVSGNFHRMSLWIVICNAHPHETGVTGDFCSGVQPCCQSDDGEINLCMRRVFPSYKDPYAQCRTTPWREFCSGPGLWTSMTRGSLQKGCKRAPEAVENSWQNHSNCSSAYRSIEELRTTERK